MDQQSNAEGLTTLASQHDFPTTLARLTEALAARRVAVFAVIDHAAGAEAAGLALRPTTVVIFGDPRAGTPLMQAGQTAGLDLPMKILVWRDASGAVWLSYNDPGWIARRHGVDPATVPATARMAEALKAFASAAAG